MTALSKCFHRDNRGSLTVEAMLTLPVLFLALFLCIGLIYSIHSAMILDRALAETCDELAENSYLLRQAWGLGMDFFRDNEAAAALVDSGALGLLAQNLGGYLLAESCLDRLLQDYPDIKGAITWQLAMTPGPEGGGAQIFGFEEEGLVGEVLAGLQSWAGAVLSEDDVVLVLSFKPAKLNRITALLPDSWEITFAKRQKAWLVGRNLRPHRGQEQEAGKKDDGPLVYITRWGIKYHLDGCRYLAKSQIPAYLNQLSEAYDACSVCRPPPRQ